MMAAKQREPQMAGCDEAQRKQTGGDPEIEWAHCPGIVPGDYHAYRKSAKWYTDPAYKRWTCILRFEILAENLEDTLATVPMGLNGGAGEKPCAGRRSRYFAAWVKANGEPPHRE